MSKEELRQKEIESRLQLADAMTRVALAIEEFPHVVKQSIATAFQSMLNLPGQPQALREVFPSLAVESLVVHLSDEQKEEMSETIYQAIQPQMTEFNQFVKNSLKTMPPNQLKRLAEKVKTGVVPKLSQRPGCICMETGDIETDDFEDFYLKM
jgi:hypothetical protein